MATMNEPMIQLTDVSKAYGDVTVLDKVNLEVKRGEFLVLLGAAAASPLC
jgi:NitT/TauT family transport system ATP-binding protein